MDKSKFSIIGHRSLAICNPISSNKWNRAMELLCLQPHHKVVDLGAGKGELLVRTIARYGVHGTAVEMAGGLGEEIVGNSLGRIPPQNLHVVFKDAKLFLAQDLADPFDAAFCTGSIHAFGSYHDAIIALGNSVREGGLVLIGHGYWKKTPAPELLRFLGTSADELGTHESNVSQAEALRLTPLWASVASEEEWDEYEWQYSLGIESYVKEFPADPDVPLMKERIRQWRSCTLKWGREAFGFGLYLFRKEGPIRENR